MKFYVGFLVALVAVAQPTQAFLGAKLALLGALTGGGGGGGGGFGGSGSGYGSGGYNGGYNQGYYSGPSRPTYYGKPSYGGGYGGGNYGGGSYGGGSSYGGSSYGGSYGGGYGGGYSGGEQVVKVIKVIVPQQSYSSGGYGGGYSSGGYAGGYSSGWTPVSAPAPVATSVVSQPTSYVATQSVATPAVRQVVQVPAPAPVQVVQQPAPVQVVQQPPQVQISQPAPVQVQVQQPAQTYQYASSVQYAPSVQYTAQAPSVAIQPPPRPTYYQVPAPQPAPQTVSSNVQTVKTIKVIVDEPSWNSVGYSSGGTPAQTYGPPQQVSSGWATNGAAFGGSDSSWSSGNSGQWNNGFKSGGIWEKLGC